MNSTAFISSTTTLSLCTVNSTHMVVQKGQKIYLYTSRLTYLHQDLFIYTTIYLYKSRFTYRHQDIFIYIEISLSISRFLYLYQDLSIYIKFHILVLRLVYIKIHIRWECDRLTWSTKSYWFAWFKLCSKGLAKWRKLYQILSNFSKHF